MQKQISKLLLGKLFKKLRYVFQKLYRGTLTYKIEYPPYKKNYNLFLEFVSWPSTNFLLLIQHRSIIMLAKFCLQISNFRKLSFENALFNSSPTENLSFSKLCVHVHLNSCCRA